MAPWSDFLLLVAPELKELTKRVPPEEDLRAKYLREKKRKEEKLREQGLTDEQIREQVPTEEEIKQQVLEDKRLKQTKLEQKELREKELIEGELTKLGEDEYIRSGDHVYVFRNEINISTLLKELADYGTEDGKNPVQHVHLYCQRLVGLTANNGDFTLQIRDRGYALRSMHVFAAEMQHFNKLVLLGGDGRSFDLSLYYDVESGPDSFWISRGKPRQDCIHVVRSQSVRLACTPETCDSVSHFDMSRHGPAGIRISAILGEQSPSSDVAISPIQAVHHDELRPLYFFEFEHLGVHRARLQNLPHLMNALFRSAGEQLMRVEPNIPSVLAKLRYINRCAGNAPNLSGLVAESSTLLSRLELPRAFARKDPRHSKADSLFYVPQQVPETLASSMDATVTALIDANRKMETDTQIQELRQLIVKTGGATMESVEMILKGYASDAKLIRAKEEARSKTASAGEKRDELREFKYEVDKAGQVFQGGMNAHKEEIRRRFVIDFAKGIIKIAFSVAATVYSGGAELPLAVDTAKEIFTNAKFGQDGGELTRVLEAVGLAVLEVGPELVAACQSQDSFSGPIESSDSRHGGAEDQLRRAAGAITQTSLSMASRPDIDFAGMLAGWREFNIGIDNAFGIIRRELGTDTVDGLEAYNVTLKKLAVRGETLINTLREAHEARKQYLLLVAERKASDAAIAEIRSLRDQFDNVGRRERMAFLVVKHRMMKEVAQRKHVVFNMLHEGILALVYRSNDINRQKHIFSNLSPALSAELLQDQWACFKKESGNDQQPQSKTLEVSATDVCPLGWQDLLVADLETPFQISPTHSGLDNKHRMRIRAINVNFVGLGRRADGSAFKYSIILGPVMVDRASPYPSAPRSDATIVQYYMEPGHLQKDDESDQLINDRNAFAKFALCCTGRLKFPAIEKEDEGRDLRSITDIKFRVQYETLVFKA